MVPQVGAPGGQWSAGLGQLPKVQRFAREWACVLGEAGCLPCGVEEAVARLAPLAGALAEALRPPRFDPAQAYRVGAELAGSRLPGAGTLQATLRLVRRAARELCEGAEPSRTDELIDELAAGYAEGLRECSRREQQSLIETVSAARRDAERKLRTSEQRLRAIFTEAEAGIWILAPDGRGLEANPALRRMFGADPRAERHALTDRVHPEDLDRVVAEVHALTSGLRHTVHSPVRFVRTDGTVFWTDLTGCLLRDDNGEPDCLVAVVEDITERHQLRSRLHHQAYHDQLTHLPNRSLMEEQLQWAFRSVSPLRRVGLCHLDLDGFRAINDSLGHQVGDQLLLAIAARLRVAASGHLVTRTGADEFALLVGDPPSQDYLAQLAEHILTVLGPPFLIGQRLLSITASVGIVESAVRETWPTELQRAADAARSWAKDAGGGRWVAFDPRRDAEETGRLALAAGVPGAVDRNEFRLHYQPLVHLGSGELTGVEALVRWRHPEQGLLGPAEFIELTERNGAIVPLGRWVLLEACRQARRWADELGPAAPYVSVNVAPRQLTEPGWLDEVSAALADTGLDPAQLQLEITERAVLVDESGVSQTLGALREMGVRLAIDDFGAGYSSLSYLHRLPVHGLKIDGSFIRGLRGMDCRATKDDKIVEALITMAHALDLLVTAEWVETAGQARRLATLGCDIAQGNWYGCPVAPGQLDHLLRRPLAG